MATNQHIQPASILTGAILLLAAAGFPSDDPRFAFSQGRVWLVILSLGAMLLLHVTRPNKIKGALRLLFSRARPFNAALLAWWGAVLVSDVLAPDALLAFKGSAWGQMGGGQLGLCVLLFYAGQLARLEGRHWRALSIGLGVMVALALLEAVGFRPLTWLPTADPYPTTTIGQRGHLAGLFAAAAGIAAYRRAYPTLLLAGLGIALCNNTSALIAFIAVAALALILDKGKDWRPLLGAAVITALAFIGTPDFTKATCRALGNTANCIETKKLGVSDAPSLGVRVQFWRASWGMFKERPVLGWGDEQYEARWLTYLPVQEQRPLIESITSVPKDAKLMGTFPDYFYVSPSKGMGFISVSNIHPHNVFVEELQNHGLVGFSLAALTVLLLLRVDRRLSLALAGYGVYLAAWFFLFAVLPIFALLMGTLVSARLHDSSPEVLPA